MLTQAVSRAAPTTPAGLHRALVACVTTSAACRSPVLQPTSSRRTVPVAARRGRHAVGPAAVGPAAVGRAAAGPDVTRAPAGAPAAGPRTVVEVIGPSPESDRHEPPVWVSGR